MSNDVLTNVILVDDLIKDINNEITDVKDVLGLLMTERCGLAIYYGLGCVMQALEHIEKSEIRIGIAVKDMKKELEEDQDHN